MNMTQSLMDFILNLMGDDHAKAAFARRPRPGPGRRRA